MGCPNCEYLRRKLSPHEDPDFTANYLLVEPRDYILSQLSYRRQGTKEILVVQAADVFVAAFGTEPSLGDVAKMGRTLKALGWEQSKREGVTVYIIPVEEYTREQC